ncbi:MAG: hypothetical protein GC154_11155 [bacterium]|nr:hypothetical protein [bacterium]
MKTSATFARLMVCTFILMAGNYAYSMVYHVEIKDLDSKQPLSPAVAVIHHGGYKLFEVGQPATPGLEAVAEEGNPEILISEANAAPEVMKTYLGGPGATFDGFKFFIEAEPGDLLSIAAMLGRTNDEFIGLSAMALPNGGAPIEIQMEAYDAGTEPNTGMIADLGFYGNPGAGATENGVVQVIHQYTIVDDPDVGAIEFNWPPSAMLTITPMPNAIPYQFKMTSMTDGQPISPSAVTVHDPAFHVFMEGQPASPGIELLAESGSSKTLIGEMTPMPGVYQSTAIGDGGGPEQMGVIYGEPGARVTIISMFGRTNDIFTGVMDLPLPSPGGMVSMDTTTWDAGTEINTGMMADIPFYGGDGSPAENGVIAEIHDYTIIDDPDGQLNFHWPPSATLMLTPWTGQSSVKTWDVYK